MRCWPVSLVVCMGLIIIINALNECTPSLELSKPQANDKMGFSDLGNLLHSQENPLLFPFHPCGQVENPVSALPNYVYDSSSSKKRPISAPQKGHLPTSWENPPTSSNLHANSNKKTRKVGPQTCYPPTYLEISPTRRDFPISSNQSPIMSPKTVYPSTYLEIPPNSSNFHIRGKTDFLKEGNSSTKSSELFLDTGSDHLESSSKSPKTGLIPSTEPWGFMDTDINIDECLALFEYGSEELEMNIQNNALSVPQTFNSFAQVSGKSGQENNNSISEEAPKIIYTKRGQEDHQPITNSLGDILNIEKNSSQKIHDSSYSGIIVKPLHVQWQEKYGIKTTLGPLPDHQKKLHNQESYKNISGENLKTPKQIAENFYQSLNPVVSAQRDDIERIQFDEKTLAITCQAQIATSENIIKEILRRIEAAENGKQTIELSEIVKNIQNISCLTEHEVFKNNESTHIWNVKNKYMQENRSVWYKYWTDTTGIYFESASEKFVIEKIQKIFPTFLFMAEIIMTIIQKLTKGHNDTTEEYIEKMRKASKCFVELGNSLNEYEIKDGNFRKQKYFLKDLLQAKKQYSSSFMWYFLRYWIQKEYPEILPENKKLTNDFKRIFNLLFAVSIENFTNFYNGMNVQA